MIDFEKELKDILENDPLGLLAVRPKAERITADDRLVTSFQEINAFVQTHGKEPTQCRDINERKLYSRLKGLRDNAEKAESLLDHDEHGLLTADHVASSKEPFKIDNIDDVLKDDALGLLGEDEEDAENIFVLTHLPREQAKPDHVARRKKCNEFEQFEPLFKQVQAELKSGERVYSAFKSEKQIAKGKYFLLNGMLLLVANEGAIKEVETNVLGGVQVRLYCVFENGTESHMLRRSLASALWTNESSFEVVPAELNQVYEQAEKDANHSAKATGYIYVLKSLSENPEIKEIKNLFKIGFSTKPVEQRIKNAMEEPTYLLANVELVAEYKVFDANTQKFELLLHTFFAESCLNMDVFDSAGKRHSPREWFVAPLHIIDAVIQLLINGEIVNYRFDARTFEILERETS